MSVLECPVRHVRSGLEKLPQRFQFLEIDERGYPVPWFVGYIDGKPRFPTMDGDKWVRAIKNKLCWVCGQKLGIHFTFVIGPMCGINRVSSEPPSHYECAHWSARNCPFLANANMQRTKDTREDSEFGENCVGGIGIARNPGVALLWSTKSYRPVKDGMGGWVIQIGEPDEVQWYANGIPATREQVEESIRTGIPKLEEMAEMEGAMDALREAHAKLIPYLPKLDR